MRVIGFVARQLGRPSGPAARLLGPILNLLNRRMNGLAIERLDVRPDQRVLDIGFGGGVALGLLDRRMADGFIAGVDISEAMLERGRRRFRDRIASGRMELRLAGASELPFPDASFDRVLGVHTIYFWPDPEAGLREIARVIRPPGRLVLVSQPKERMEKSPVTKHGFTFYSEDELAGMLTRVGFDEPAFERRGSYLLIAADTR